MNKSMCNKVFTYAALVLFILGVTVRSAEDNHEAAATQLTQNQRLGQLEPSPEQEEWSLLIENYPIQHQGDHSLTITVNGTYKKQSNLEPLDSAIIYSEITQFLSNYPQENDYWEIVNRKLTENILRKNSALASVTVNLEVSPNLAEPYTRSTTVTCTDDGLMLESWSFITAQVAVPHHGGHKLNIAVQYLYGNGIANSEYPDFVPIYNRIAQFLTTYPNDADSWEAVNRALTNTIIKEYPMMVSFTSRLEVMPTAKSPYHYFTAVTRTQSNRIAFAPEMSL